MTYIKQLPTISPKNKGAVKEIKQDNSKDSGHTFKSTLTSINAHQIKKKKQEGITDGKISKNHLDHAQKKNESDKDDVKHINTSNSNQEEEKNENDSDNTVAVDVTFVPQQLSSKQKPINTHTIETTPFVHKPNVKIVNNEIAAKNIPPFMINEKRSDINTAFGEKKDSGINIINRNSINMEDNSLRYNALNNIDKKDNSLRYNDLNNIDKKDNSLRYNDLNNIDKKDNSLRYNDLNNISPNLVISELPQKFESNLKNLVVSNNTPITEKEWGNELSRIIKNNIKDINQLEIIVHPRHLGPIKILIEDAKGKNKISIIAKDAYVATLIGEHINNIQTKLLNSGESVASINVINDSKLNDTNQNHQNQNENKGHHDHLDFSFTNNNNETKKEQLKTSKGIIA
ncbi:flagellar hook-length control protein FliK [Photobacterium toruni]|uniref:flagellar hook-length control protein FliK n=1 Tax=Photobacterium toruni TaxID=1935446 RepID=UPI00210F5AD1|nr:flagellar hook-length control protein FliK [Photobacterium toruni]